MKTLVNHINNKSVPSNGNDDGENDNEEEK